MSAASTTPSVFDTCNATSQPSNGSVTMEFLQCITSGYESLASSQTVDVAAGLNSFFLIFGGALVFFMQAGFAMLCAGSIRAKNAKNVILWNLLDSAGGGLAFWLVGYAFAFGGGDATNPSKTFIGSTSFVTSTENGVPLEGWFFQFGFAAATSSIVAGTIAERTQMKAYLMYSTFLVGFVYPVVAHAMWSPQGFMSKFAMHPMFGNGVIDLAGSGVVHMTGGATALVAALILGPRIGRFHDQDGKLLDEPAEFPPHSVALQFLGTFCLWFGWYGFNPCSVGPVSSASQGELAALVAMNTTLAACAGAVSAMFFSSFMDWRKTGIFTYDVVATMNGSLTGLAAVTSGCATYDTWGGVTTGLLAGIVYVLASKLIIRLRIDDAVDAIPVHLFGGMLGLIMSGLISSPTLIERAYPNSGSEHAGWLHMWSEGSGDFHLIGAQLVAIIFIFSWSFTMMGLFFGAMNYLGWYRVDAIEELAGLDISRHKGQAYFIENATDEHVEMLNQSRRPLTKEKTETGVDVPAEEAAAEESKDV